MISLNPISAHVLGFTETSMTDAEAERYIQDLRENLAVVTALLKERDSTHNAETEVSSRRIAEAEALLARRPKIKVRETVDAG